MIIPYNLSNISIGYYYIIKPTRIITDKFLLRGQFRTPFKTKWPPETPDDVIFLSDVIYVTPTSVAILAVSLVTIAKLTRNLRAFV